VASELVDPVRFQRPDLIDLIGPEFDRPTAAPAQHTLIICSAPRTGSYELCRFLIAAGIGVPHEYFHPSYARQLAQRWSFAGDPLGEGELDRYIDVLRRHRSQNDVFATKLQFRQFDRSLRNAHGAALFDSACVVHLFRPDVATQFASLRAAKESGVWDFSARQTLTPVTRPPTGSSEFLHDALEEMNWILGEDAGFRGLFVLLGIRPLFVTSDDLFADPSRVVRRIGEAMSVMIDEEGLRCAITASAPYGRDRRERSIAGLKELFKKVAFSNLKPRPRSCVRWR
jgi:trehalose 2-sulfotransferase